MKPAWLVALAAGVFGAAASAQTSTSGILPEVSVLLISEADGQAQLGVQNSDSRPLLLHTRIYGGSDEPDLKVLPLPPVTRVNPHARQVVRFVLEKPAAPLTVQHYRRVTFEGIPAPLPDTGKAQVQVNLRYDLPVIISPRGLPPDEQPWKRVVASTEGPKVVLSNPSPYVVRMSREVLLLPSQRSVELLSRTALLPGERLSVALPADIPADSVTAIRLFPATLYGAAAKDYDAVINR